jgi:hypothetical protein
VPGRIVPIFQPQKAAALLVAGHEHAGLALRGERVVVLFDETPDLQADVRAYERARDTLIAMQKGDLPLQSDALTEAVGGE